MYPRDSATLPYRGVFEFDSFIKKLYQLYTQVKKKTSSENPVSEKWMTICINYLSLCNLILIYHANTHLHKVWNYLTSCKIYDGNGYFCFCFNLEKNNVKLQIRAFKLFTICKLSSQSHHTVQSKNCLRRFLIILFDSVV